MSEELLAFRKDYPVSTFPVTAKFLQYEEPGQVSLHSRVLHSRQEWRQFLQELAKREPLGEWAFLAYYEVDTST